MGPAARGRVRLGQVQRGHPEEHIRVHQLEQLLREGGGAVGPRDALRDRPPEESRGRSMAGSVAIDPAPADCPQTVTRSGSPPGAGDVLPHPAQGRDPVEQATVGRGSGELGEAFRVHPVR
ncbi:hypothetical protein GCM10010219_48780 [Streptomyces netropsis]|nr:hypothetical protein GCM10010219_48780 [Streptomyces netropsis]